MNPVRDKLLLGMHDDVILQSADGFDSAILGIAYGFEPPKLVYSISRILEILIEEGCTYEEAREHFDYNIGGGYIGEQTPIWVEDELIYEPAGEES
jgi:hypothetical protein